MTAWLWDRRARPKRGAWWFAAALLAAFATAFAIALAGVGADRAARAPASSALGAGPPVAVPLRPVRLRDVAPMPRLQETAARPTPAPAPPAPARPATTAAPTVTAEPTPTQGAIPPAPAPAPTRAPPRQRTETPTIGQEFDSSG